MISQLSAASRRTIAEPTIPLCPATKTRLPRRSKSRGEAIFIIASTASAKAYRVRFQIPPLQVSIGQSNPAGQCVYTRLMDAVDVSYGSKADISDQAG